MKVISVNTKISELIKFDPAVIDIIAGINKHFRKLQNPLLRKMLASRINIGEAAKIGGCEPEVFFERLKPLGFVVEDTIREVQGQTSTDPVSTDYDLCLDVRMQIEQGKDPLPEIMETVNSLKADERLLLINSFEPIPLIRILQSKQYRVTVNKIAENVVHTYIERTASSVSDSDKSVSGSFRTFGAIREKFADRLVYIDVRSLEMPQPMIRIIDKLNTLPAGHALYVHHKKIPLYLLPELKAKNFNYVLFQENTSVFMIIYKHHDL
jgi:uncharacterized protein (DUF2249 family)